MKHYAKIREKLPENFIHNMLSHIINDPELFKPNVRFYERVGINKKRWAIMYNGYESPKITEIVALSDYFRIPLDTMLTFRQLNLYPETIEDLDHIVAKSVKSLCEKNL